MPRRKYEQNVVLAIDVFLSKIMAPVLFNTLNVSMFGRRAWRFYCPLFSVQRNIEVQVGINQHQPPLTSLARRDP